MPAPTIAWRSEPGSASGATGGLPAGDVWVGDMVVSSRTARSCNHPAGAVTSQQSVRNRFGEPIAAGRTSIPRHAGSTMTDSLAEQAAATISRGIGRRGFAHAVAGVVAGVGLLGTAAGSSSQDAGGPA